MILYVLYGLFTNFTLMSHFLQFTRIFNQIVNIANIVWVLYKNPEYCAISCGPLKKISQRDASYTKTTAIDVTLHPRMQAIWRHIWKPIMVKSQTNATNTTMYPFMHVIWGHIWKCTVEKSQTIVTNVTASLNTRFLKTRSGEKSNKCNKCDITFSWSGNFRKQMGQFQIPRTTPTNGHFSGCLWAIYHYETWANDEK